MRIDSKRSAQRSRDALPTAEAEERGTNMPQNRTCRHCKPRNEPSRVVPGLPSLSWEKNAPGSQRRYEPLQHVEDEDGHAPPGAQHSTDVGRPYVAAPDPTDIAAL